MAWDVYTPPPLYDASNGNINLQVGCGATLRLRFQNATAAFIDISAWSLFFMVDGKFRLALTPGADATAQLIVITPALTDSLGRGTSYPYLIRDETTSQFLRRASGLITATGLASIPT